MYRYDEYDQQIVDERVTLYRDQVRRRLANELTEDEFLPLRLQNGLYMQVHGYMLRIAVPYGLISATQMRMFAHIARKYDRGYGHFTTRQNIQFNWLRLEDTPDILADLASVEMHAIQTSGNCIRNITSDEYAGVAQDEVIDPRPYAEILRQWSTFHPEFAFLPRKFKIAISGGKEDRAAITAHDIGLSVTRNTQGEIGFRVLVGGGLGRTPIIGSEICEFVPWQHILTYAESILRIYNQYGRRDNKYKARIKILVTETGIDEFRDLVDAEYATLEPSDIAVSDDEIARIQTAWQLALSRYGSDGGFLFGRFSIADCMYAPVVSRLLTYDIPMSEDVRNYSERLMALPAMVEWLAGAQKEIDEGLPDQWLLDMNRNTR